MSQAQPEPSRSVALADGTRARALAFADGVLLLVCERAYPPGKPLSLLLHHGDGELALQGKSAGSRRREDGDFDVRLKLVSLRRVEREQLTELFPPNEAPPDHE